MNTVRNKVISVICILLLLLSCGCSSKLKRQKLPVKVLLLPKFEQGKIKDDFPGEAQYFYDEYLSGGEEYEIGSGQDTEKLYYKDGVAMFLLGQGKVSAALGTSAVLSDDRFDFSDAYIISVGCGGAAKGYGIFGDVFVITAAVDYDLGNKADPREMADDTGTTWFHNESFDDGAFVKLDKDLTDRVYEKVKDVHLETTEKSRKYLRKEFAGEKWAEREPKVMKGTSVTGDNYWKGEYDHNNALLVTETYDCADPYAITEMEDVAVGQAVRRFGMLDRLIILRVGVNIDVFPEDMTPEMLWDEEVNDTVAAENSLESLDIFETGMQNCFDTGRVVIDAALDGTL